MIKILAWLNKIKLSRDILSVKPLFGSNNLRGQVDETGLLATGDKPEACRQAED